MRAHCSEKFDYIVVETTGMANPAPVASVFWVDDELNSQASVSVCLCVCVCVLSRPVCLCVSACACVRARVRICVPVSALHVCACFFTCSTKECALCLPYECGRVCF